MKNYLCSIVFVLGMTGCSSPESSLESTPQEMDSENQTGDESLSDSIENPLDVQEDTGVDAAEVSEEEADAEDSGENDTQEADTESDSNDSSVVDSGPTVDEIPPPEVVPDFGNCSEPGGSLNIYDIQNPECPDHFDPEPVEAPGAYIFLTDVVVTGVFSDTTFVQESPGGPYSGISVYNGSVFAGELEVGDVVDLEGYYYEFFGNTQLTMEKVEVMGKTTPLEPFLATHPTYLATDGPLAEMFEGVFVEVQDVFTIHTKPDCPNDFEEFLVTGDLRIDDMGYRWDAKLGDAFSSIRGVMHYTFENHKLEPRTEDDIAWLGKGDANSESKCVEGDCQVPKEVLGTHEIIISEIMADPYEQDTSKEWVEFHNPTNNPVDIYGWELRDCADQKFKITGPDLVIPPNGYLVVGASLNESANGGVSVDVAYASGFYLPNTVGSALLFDGPGPTANLIDQARYMAFQEWDMFQSGHSLERTSADSDGTLASSWKKGKSSYGNAGNFGTPGKKNDSF